MRAKKIGAVGLVLAAFVAGVLLTRLLLSGDEGQQRVSEASPTTSSTAVPSSSLSATASTLVSPTAAQELSCGQVNFIQLWVGTPAPETATATCADKYALVLFKGASVGVHGAQFVLFERSSSGEGYVDVAWGSTSHGTISVFDLQEAGIDATTIVTLFPGKIFEP